MKIKVKLNRISRKNFFVSFFNLILVIFLIVSSLLLVSNVIIPLIKSINEGQSIYNDFQSIIRSVEKDPSFIWTFFQTDILNNGNITDTDLIFAIQKKMNNIFELQKKIEEISANFQDPEGGYLLFFNDSVDFIVKSIKEIIKPENNRDIFPLTTNGQELLEKIVSAKTLVNDVNNVASNWFNLDFNLIFKNFIIDGNQDINPYINDILKSRALIMAIVIVISLLFLLISSFILFISSIIFKARNNKLYDLKISNWLVNLNIFLSLFFVLNLISWLSLWIISKKRINEDAANDEFVHSFSENEVKKDDLRATTKLDKTLNNIYLEETTEISKREFIANKNQKYISSQTQEIYTFNKKDKKSKKDKKDHLPSFTDLYH